MRIHELKCWLEFFQHVKSGRKTFEYRKNDRDFAVGDVLHLREFDPRDGGHYTYSWQECLCKVTYIVTEAPGLPEGYCIMGIEVIDA